MSKRKLHVLGLGVDNEDGHHRVTKADEYTLVGGSKETHERMQEIAAKIEEKAKKRGKSIASLEAEECHEIIEEVDK